MKAKRTPRMTSWLGPHFLRFVAIKRAAGGGAYTQHGLLEAFDRYVAERVPDAPLSREHVLDYLEGLKRLSVRGRDNAISVVWQALDYAILHQAPVEALPPRPPMAPRGTRLRPPRLITPHELADILAATRHLPTHDESRPSTIRALLGLLWTTGMRIGEALALDVGDLDPTDGLLTIRRGKFGKTRILPLRDSTVRALERYLQHPKRRLGTARAAPFFALRQRRLSYGVAANGFRQATTIAGIGEPGAPRFHDIRHTFAIGSVAACYAKGGDVHKLLPLLSTYLGHVSIDNTCVYLRANGVLLEHASRLFDGYAQSLDGGQP